MRHIKASEAKEQFDTLLKDVEGGAIVSIDRDGRQVARLMPARGNLDHGPRSSERQAEIERAIASIKAIRERTSPVTVEEILSARNEGRR